MTRGKRGDSQNRVIQIISFGIEVRVRNPIIHIFERLVVAPEELDSLSITISAIGKVVRVADHIFYQVGVFFIVGFYSESLSVGDDLIVQNEMLSAFFSQLTIDSQKLILCRLAECSKSKSKLPLASRFVRQRQSGINARLAIE